jgi:signal transduction histidine kinase
MTTIFVIGSLIYLVSVNLGSTDKGFGMNYEEVQDEPPSSDIMGLGGVYKARPERLEDKIKTLFGIDLSTMIIIILLVVISSILLFGFYYSLFCRKITNDLSMISYNIKRIAKGETDEKIKYKKNDEIGDISKSVNALNITVKNLMDKERQVLKANKDLITCIAHDLRTPITSVVGYIQLAVDEENFTSEERKKYADIAVQKSNRLEKMIEDLFNYTKISSGELKLKKTEIDLVMLIEQMIEEFYPMLESNQMECTFINDEKTATVCVDVSLFARALSNLFSNACKYGKDGKKLIVKFSKKDDMYYIAVTNFGLVIPEESLSHLFEKFYRVEDSRSESTGGTGLGLNIAKEVMLMHDGDLTVKSDITGTTFTMSLPQMKGDDKE